MDVTKLTTARLTAVEYDVPSVGKIKIRPLSRAEGLKHANRKMDTLVAEQKLLSMALVDPVMSEEDVAAWQQAAPAGELHDVFMFVATLSGMREESPKDAYKSAGE